jgi:hypothetical protein
MTKPLPLDGFREARFVLEPKDFAVSPGREPRPSDLMDEETWRDITTPSDTVSITTSNRHGTCTRPTQIIESEKARFLEGPLQRDSQFDCSARATFRQEMKRRARWMRTRRMN